MHFFNFTASVQEPPFGIGATNLSQYNNIQQFREKSRNYKRLWPLIKIIGNYILSGFRNVQKW